MKTSVVLGSTNRLTEDIHSGALVNIMLKTAITIPIRHTRATVRSESDRTTTYLVPVIGVFGHTGTPSTAHHSARCFLIESDIDIPAR